MAKRVVTDDKEGAASAVPSDIHTANLETWPFGVERAPIQGFLRSLVPERADLIQDYGNGVALYPPYLEDGPPRMVQPDNHGWSCSGIGCKKAPFGCVHIWEHRFRCGDLKDRGFVPPIRAVRIRVKGGVPYENVERYLPRPDARIGGRSWQSLVQIVREEMPTRTRTLLGDLAHILRERDAHKRRRFNLKRPVGRPGVDVWDAAVLAIMRIMDRHAYSGLAFQSDTLSVMTNADGDPLVTTKFKPKRVNEIMTGWARRAKDGRKREDNERRLTFALEQMVEHLLRYFRDITEVVMCDGKVFSTAQSDNSRRGRFDGDQGVKSSQDGTLPDPKTQRKSRSRATQVLAHLMWEPRWGVILAWRLTWNQRGRGSGEAPQFPYLLRNTLAKFHKVKTVLGDMAYGSDRNHFLCLMARVWLVCELKPNQFGKGTEYLSADQAQEIRERNSHDNPLFRQYLPFRNIVEGCNSILQHVTPAYFVSRVDRSRMPLTKAEKLKENPNKAEAELPEDQDERDLIVETEQFVGRACYNEMLCRQIVTLLRGIARAEAWYETKINLAFDTPFQPRPEDIEFSMLRPRLEPPSAA